MNYRSFGKTGLRVSEIGFGDWAIGGNAVVGGTPIGWGLAVKQRLVDLDTTKWRAVVETMERLG